MLKDPDKGWRKNKYWKIPSFWKVTDLLENISKNIIDKIILSMWTLDTFDKCHSLQTLATPSADQ